MRKYFVLAMVFGVIGFLCISVCAYIIHRCRKVKSMHGRTNLVYREEYEMITHQRQDERPCPAD
ncbi:hypothetical protein DPMN_052535 [Dreissena polymorpha]|uniref:Uncharacterized protein n=1 Tax=Dreissena polymorpha TaxID=45954 RepID=A0A9D4CM44_DREPO|nr:hypothetical protein DPMN_052535 [Dreissena polymorpha]